MTQLTLPDLRRILEEGAGVSEGADWTVPTVEDTPFDDLGYDSLALLELTAQMQQRYGVRIPDDAVTEMKTPRLALVYLNERLREA